MEEVSPGWLRDGVEFQVKLRGYDPAQVDDLLDRVAGGIELLQQQLRDALNRAARAEREAAESAEADQALRRTLVLAQRTADEAVADARETAARLEAEARDEAEKIVAGAHGEAKRVAAAAQRTLRDDLAALERARDTLQTDVRALEQFLAAERERLHRVADGEFEVGALPEASPIDVPPAPDVEVAELDAEPAGDAPEQDAPAALVEGEPGEQALAHDVPPAPSVQANGEADDAEGGDDLEVEVPDDLSTLDDHEARNDPFLAELRKAHTDDAPLGPRDEELLEGFEGLDGEHDLGLDRSWWGRRRRR